MDCAPRKGMSENVLSAAARSETAPLSTCAPSDSDGCARFAVLEPPGLRAPLPLPLASVCSEEWLLLFLFFMRGC
jgi:hypothetical protein